MHPLNMAIRQFKYAFFYIFTTLCKFSRDKGTGSRPLKENKSNSELQQLHRDKRNEIIRKLKLIEGVTIGQLSRITGISKSVIDRTI